MTNTTVLKISRASASSDAARAALREAGFGLLETTSWDQAKRALQNGEAELVVADGDAIREIADNARPAAGGVSRDAMRTLSHELRTPLSAMAGWLHLMESGKLDEAGLKRAIDKLRNNIDDQVKTIDRYLGANSQEGQR